MATFVKAKDYFDPRIYERMAQINANNALRQGDIRANQSLQTAQIFANLLPQLAKLYTDYSQKKETSDYFSPKDYSVGDIPRGQQQVITDLLGKPITEPSQFAPDFGQQRPAPVTIPQYQEQGTFDPTQDPQRLMRATIQQDNPFLQQAGQQGLQNFLMQQAKPMQFDPTKDTYESNIFNKNYGKTTLGRPKPSEPFTLSPDQIRYSGTGEPIAMGFPKSKTEEKKLPTGFAQITDPATKAKIWNDVYGGNLTDKDFKEIQERPYFQPVTDRDGKIHIFDSRTGKILKDESDIIKAAPTEVRQQVVAFNDNLNTVKEIKKIVGIGDLTGVVKGRARKIGTKFFSDKEAQTLTNRLAQLRTIIYGLSGKQINESEQDWLENEILPQMRQPTENFETTLNEFEAWITRRKGALINQFPNVKDIQDTPKPATVTEQDIDKMTKEQLEQFLKGQ